MWDGCAACTLYAVLQASLHGWLWRLCCCVVLSLCMMQPSNKFGCIARIMLEPLFLFIFSVWAFDLSHEAVSYSMML